MKVESLEVALLKENPNNTRKHSDEQIKAMVESIGLYGQYRPIVVDEDNMILAGHGIFMALQERGDKTVFVHRIPGLSDKEKKKLLVVDNRVQALGWDDYDKIEELLKDIGEVEIPGFDEDFMNSILASFDEESMNTFIEEKEESSFGSKKGSSEEQKAVKEKLLSGNADEEYSDEAFEGVGGDVEIVCPHCGKPIKL